MGARVYLEDLHALRLGRGSFIWKQAGGVGIQKQEHGYRNPIGQFESGDGFTWKQVPRGHEDLIIADLALSRAHLVFRRTVCSPPRPGV